MEDEFSVGSLLMLARQHQSNPALLDRPITDKQLTAIHAKLTSLDVKFKRSAKLEVFREILGYSDILNSTKDLTMADAFGIMGLSDQDLGTLIIWAGLEIEKGVRI